MGDILKQNNKPNILFDAMLKTTCLKNMHSSESKTNLRDYIFNRNK